MTSDPAANFTPLCFDRADFGRQDFNVEKFLLKARRRGNSFEEIREDLRVFLKIIQNSMIELINKDYADFVQLSSNLAGLRGAVEKLNSEVSDLVGDFNDISSKIQQSVDLLSTKFDEKSKVQSDLERLHATIAAHHKLDQLKSILTNRQMKNSIVILDRINYQLLELKTLTVVKNEQLGNDFQTNFLQCIDVYQNLLENLFVDEINSMIKSSDRKRNSRNLDKILNSFDACGRVDSAHAVFLNEFVDGEFRQIFSPKKSAVPIEKPAQLNQVLNCLVELYKKYSPFFNSNSDCQVPTFLSDCLLTALLSCLDDKFGNLLFPTDPNVFRKSYSLMINFFGAWLDECLMSQPEQNRPPVNSGLVRMIFNKFNLSVYFQLRKQDILSNLEKSFEIKYRPVAGAGDQEGVLSLYCTSTLLNCVQQIWSDDENGVYLPPLTSKCFELTFLLLNRFEYFLGEVSREFAAKGTTTTPAHEHSSSVNGTPTDIDSTKVTNIRSTSTTVIQSDIDLVINVASDVFSFERIFQDLYKNLITPKLKPHNIAGTVTSSSDTTTVEFASSIQIYDQCLNDTFHKLHVRVDRLIGDTLRDVLARKVASHLSAVGEIPRQYRWTRKESPNQASLYVSQAFQSLRDFVDCARNRLPEDRVTSTVSSLLKDVVQAYAADIKSVVESVDKISSSLNKLKRSGKGTSNMPDTGTTTASDDDKIRMQLNLDVKEFSRLVSSLQLPIDNCDINVLDEIINAKSVEQ